jgi:hypothetical protein
MDKGRTQRGAVLMITLVFFTLAFLLIGGLLTSALVHERTLALHRGHVQCVYLVDSGLAWARLHLAQDPDWPGGVMEVPLGAIEVEISVQASGRRELFIRGRTESAKSQVRVWLDEEGRVLLWQEVAASH